MAVWAAPPSGVLAAGGVPGRVVPGRSGVGGSRTRQAVHGLRCLGQGAAGRGAAL